MKLISNITITIILLLPINQAFALEKITGAFGIELGQKLDESITHEEIDGSPNLYMFIPKNGFRSLGAYILKVTPKAHLIYTIESFGPMESESACKKELGIITNILEKKYGEKLDRGQPPYDSIAEIIVGKNLGMNVMIKTECKPDKMADKDESWGWIDVQYSDLNLAKQAEKEEIEMLDSSGL